MSATVLLVSGRTETREQVRAVLAEADAVTLQAVVGEPDEVTAAMARAEAPTDIVLVDEVVDGRDGLDVVREIGVSHPLSAVVLMAVRPTPELLAAAMDAGARSVVSSPPSLEEVRTRIESAAAWARAARRHVAADAMVSGDVGRIVAVAGAKGGVGTSVLALLLARARAAQMTVCLVDLDLRAGDLAPYLGVQVRRSVIDLIDIADELSGRALGETTYDVGGDLRFLAAPTEGEYGEAMTARAARQILSALRYQYDLVVVDCGSRLDDATAVALEIADRALLVATPDVPSLRAARRAVVQWERLDVRSARDVDLVLNQTRRSTEVQPPLASKLAGVTLTATVPQVGPPLETVMNTATLLAARIPPLDKAVVALADTVAAPVAAPTVPTAPDEPPPGRRRRARTLDRQAGQIVVEAPVVFGIAVVLLVLCLQFVMHGLSFMVAQQAADEAARTYAVAASPAQVRDRVEDVLPGAWSSGWTVQRPAAAPSTVEVTVRTPRIVPGVSLAATSTSTIMWEP